MALLDIGTWDLVDLALGPQLHTAVAALFGVAGPRVLALQGLGERIRLPEGVAGFQPEGTDGGDGNAVLWLASRFAPVDCYVLGLTEAGRPGPDGTREPTPVAPVVLLRDLESDALHAFASVRMPAGLDVPVELDPRAETRRAVSAQALHGLGNHADRLRRRGYAVHVGGTWGVDVLGDDGHQDAWPEAALGDLLTSARRHHAVRLDQAPTVDWRTTAPVRSVNVIAQHPGLLVAGLAEGSRVRNGPNAT